jgi:hypothetical protein
MGAKTWMLVYADTNVAGVLQAGRPLDRDATFKLATTLFPKDKLVPIGDGSLVYTNPPDDELHIGCFPGVSILAAREFGIDHPSKLPEKFVAQGRQGAIYLHAMHSVVDWLAFAQWSQGTLMRSLSLSPDKGILEDIGVRLPFEEPFWAGQHPATDDEDEDAEYPFPFHPLELGEEVLKQFFGYQLEGPNHPALLDPETIPLVKYKRTRAWWKFW